MQRTRVAALVAAVPLVAGTLVASTAGSAPAAEKATYVKKSIRIGTTVKGRAITAHYTGWSGASKTLLIIGQMHGNEKGGVTTARYVWRYLRAKPGTGIWVVTTMNPDGSAAGTRRNARGVDLNRNWPTSGWTGKGKGTSTWGGPSKGSERETRAMMSFLKDHHPDLIASLHQPFGVVAANGKSVTWEKRLAYHLDLPRKGVPIGTPSGKLEPTLVGWYNRYLGRHGSAVTVEYTKHPSSSFLNRKAGTGITVAARVR